MDAKNKVRMYKYYFKKSCNYIFEIIKSCNYIFEIIILYLYHIDVVILLAQPSTNIITLQYELDIYILGSNTAWRGGGGAAPNAKFRHCSWEQMMTELRSLSVHSYIL